MGSARPWFGWGDTGCDGAELRGACRLIEGGGKDAQRQGPSVLRPSHPGCNISNNLARRNVPFARIEPIKALRKNKYKPGMGAGTLQVFGEVEGPIIPLSDYDCLNGTEPH